MEAPATRPGSASAWAAATRPRSLLIAFSPVLVGAVLGWTRTGTVDAAAALLVLAAALLMQLITNLQNDVGYTLRGAERSGTRTGLPRATAEGTCIGDTLFLVIGGQARLGWLARRFFQR